MEKGTKVTWKSQAGGYWKEKTGEVIAFVIPHESANQYLPEGTKPGHINFQNRSEFDRVLVKVPRGGKSVISDYYAPRKSQVTEVTN